MACMYFNVINYIHILLPSRSNNTLNDSTNSCLAHSTTPILAFFSSSNILQNIKYFFKYIVESATWINILFNIIWQYLSQRVPDLFALLTWKFKVQEILQDTKLLIVIINPRSFILLYFLFKIDGLNLYLIPKWLIYQDTPSSLSCNREFQSIL